MTIAQFFDAIAGLLQSIPEWPAWLLAIPVVAFTAGLTWAIRWDLKRLKRQLG